MRILVLLFSLIFCGSTSFAQQKIDLSKAPVGTHGLNSTKSNATILSETTPQHNNKNQEVNLSEKYKADGNIQGTFRTVNQNNQQPSTFNNNTPEVMNGSTQQINLGTGTKANSTTYYDNEGKVRGTNTTIQFGK